MKIGEATAIRHRGRAAMIASALMMTTALVPIMGAGAAWAQQTSDASILAKHAFDIPAQPLTSALAQFGLQSGLQVTVDGALARGLTGQAVSGALSSDRALDQLLRGTGLTYSVAGDDTVVITALNTGNADAATTVLDPVRVEATAGGYSGPNDAITNSFVAGRTTTASKTDTPILDDPTSVSVITQKEMETRNVQDISQAVGYTSGVTVSEYGSDNRYEYVRIRGFGSQSLGMYRDGLPSRIYNFVGARQEPYGVQQIDVLKGSTSSLFGLNGPGGLVNMTTKRPQDDFHAEVFTTFGEDHLTTGTDFGGPIDADGKWSYRLTGLWQDAEQEQDYSQDDRVYIAPAFTYKPKDGTELTILTSYNNRESGLGYGFPIGIETSRNAFFGEPDFNNYDTEQTEIGYQFSHDLSDALTFRQNARYTKLNLDYEAISLANTAPLGDRTAFAVYGEQDRFSLDNQLQYDTAWEQFDSKTLVGIDFNRDKNRERRFDGSASPIDPYNPSYCGRSCIDLNFTSDTEITQTAYGLYAQEQLTIANDWIATFGGRYDYVQTDTDTLSSNTLDERDDQEFTSRLGLTYKVTDEMSVYGNYSESFQPINTSSSITPGGSKPQTGTQYEVGFKYQPTNIDALFTAALFDLTQENVSQYDGATKTYMQVGRINTQGLELEGKMSLGDRTNLTLAYSYLDAEIEDDAIRSNIGNRPELIPEHTASAWVDYTIPEHGVFGDLTLGAGARFVGARYNNNANGDLLGSHTVFDAAVNYAVTENVSLAVNATNLFDREYVASNSFGSRFYGDGRTVLATVKYTW